MRSGCGGERERVSEWVWRKVEGGMEGKEGVEEGGGEGEREGVVSPPP